MAENLMAQKLSVTLMDMGGQILPNVLDPEMAGYAAVTRFLTTAQSPAA